MATSTAGAWQSGARPERPYPARAPRPSAAADRPMRSSSRSGAPGPGRSGDRARPVERDRVRDRYEQSAPVQRGTGRPHPADRAADRPAERSMAPARAGSAPDSRLRGFLALVAVFLLTLAGCAVDSFVGSGLGLITLVALTASTAAAVLLVRRRDLLSVIVAPPLVFAAVAAVNVAMAPSATLNLPTMATLLVRGFPTMAAATVAAIVLAVFRMATRR
ncbi:hypothetical protein GCU60_17595 [Blastococcus saxobsidens]|uniref:DUF6542 domain-containing protein n=1 Tax=Blastococcus saxobsidens TaxID=138336 RepID=A0A6L9W663_9ACTN|nr:DUF6542 domain-containing protein [Blastococcus saxobsidens]NEK87555.1 hypothetical protein [Blastococcus saxobsidens]